MTDRLAEPVIRLPDDPMPWTVAMLVGGAMHRWVVEAGCLWARQWLNVSARPLTSGHHRFDIPPSIERCGEKGFFA